MIRYLLLTPVRRSMFGAGTIGVNDPLRTVPIFACRWTHDLRDMPIDTQNTRTLTPQGPRHRQSPGNNAISHVQIHCWMSTT
jgi:hypothetical protein